MRPLTAPATGHAHAFRCTTAGTSGAEPTWPTANNSTVTTGGATFTNVTGQSTYGWSAAAGDLYSISQAAGWNRPVSGDRVFLSSDHSETLNLATQTYSFNNGTSGYGVIKLVSVNRGGSVPPVPGDITVGATLNANDAAVINVNLEAYCDMYWEGISVIVTSNVTAANFNFNSGANKEHYFKNCSLQLNTTGTGRFSCANCVKVILDNTPLQFGATGQSIVPNSGYAMDLTWINTASAIQGATVPSTLFTMGGSGALNAICRGVDLSAITGQLVGTGISAPAKVLFDSCRIASGVTRFPVTAGTTAVVGHEVDLINCYDGTNVIHERYTEAGAVTTDHSTYLTGGAADDVGNYSLKMASNANSDFTTLALNNFWFDVENTVTGSSKTATVEIISSASLNNNDIRLLLEYMGAASGFAVFDGTTTTNVTLSNGNLTATHSSSATNSGVQATSPKSYGKYYFEVTIGAAHGNNDSVAVVYPGTVYSSVIGGQGGIICFNGASGVIYNNGTNTGSTVGSWSAGDVICAAVDFYGGNVWFRRNNGNWNGSGTANPATGTGGIGGGTISSSGPLCVPVLTFGGTGTLSGDNMTANFGQSAFAYAVPSGFTPGWYSVAPASFVDSLPTVLTATAALGSSSATWNSPPSTPQAQHIQVTFTPQKAGRVRGLVRLGKPSTTVWVNPQIAIT